MVCLSFFFQQSKSKSKSKKKTCFSHSHSSSSSPPPTTAHVQPYDFWSVVRESVVVSQQISIVAIFVIVFKHVLDSTLSEYFLISMDFVLALGGYVAILFLMAQSNKSNEPRETFPTPGSGNNPSILRNPLFAAAAAAAAAANRNTVNTSTNANKSSSSSSNPTFSNQVLSHTFRLCVIVAILLTLSPVLRTLTEAYSDDTIWSMTIMLLAIHLFAHDYSFVNAYTTK